MTAHLKRQELTELAPLLHLRFETSLGGEEAKEEVKEEEVEEEEEMKEEREEEVEVVVKLNTGGCLNRRGDRKS